MTLEDRFNRLKATPSSINEHLELLRDYASRCETVAEFGVDIGQSTTAFLMAQPELLVSVDTCWSPELGELTKCADDSADNGDPVFGRTIWEFHHMSSLDCDLPMVDMLLIDSAHCYAQITAELARHHAQVRCWILCHDIVAYGEYGEAGPPQVGIQPAIDEFLAAHPEWHVTERLLHNNGLLIMERVNGN